MYTISPHHAAPKEKTGYTTSGHLVIKPSQCLGKIHQQTEMKGGRSLFSENSKIRQEKQSVVQILPAIFTWQMTV